MTRIYVICEGQTEELFVNEVLGKPFSAQGIYLYPRLIGKPGHKGGNFKIERLLTDLRSTLGNDTGAYCTTFFDYYGLPESFPGKKESSSKVSSADKSASLLDEMGKVIQNNLGQNVMRRFIPYVQMHEFEGLLFSDPEALARGIDQPDLAADFASIRGEFSTPEDINNSAQTAPSKRIESLYRQYEKPTHGSLAALEIGLNSIRSQCPLFHGWLQQLEALAATPPL